MTEPVVHVIDDDEAMRESIGFLLDTAGLASRTYESAVAFLAQADSLAPGCIVTDIRMPEMSGLELARRLKDRGVPHPLIVITGHGDVPLAVEAMKIGVADFLEKPFDDDALLNAVTACLNQQAESEQQAADRRRFEEMLRTLSPRETEVLRGVVEGKPTR